jgi:hypothetical protein
MHVQEACHQTQSSIIHIWQALKHTIFGNSQEARRKPANLRPPAPAMFHGVMVNLWVRPQAYRRLVSIDEQVDMEKADGNSKLRALHRALAVDTELDGVDLRVFLYLFSRLDFENYMRVSQLEIAEVLERRKEHISRSMKKLTEKRIILEGGKVNRSSTWRLNPDYGLSAGKLAGRRISSGPQILKEESVPK